MELEFSDDWLICISPKKCISQKLYAQRLTNYRTYAYIIYASIDARLKHTPKIDTLSGSPQGINILRGDLG